MLLPRRRFAVSATALSAALAFPSIITRPVWAQKKKLSFGVGPLLPNPEDTKKAYQPFFAHLAKSLGASEFDLVATTDWAGIAVAMGSGQLDVAWMGPWGYVLANSTTQCYAVATVKYDEKPLYYAIIVGRPGLKIARFPDDSKGMSISFADVGSTSGWLIPTYYAREVWKIDPKAYWKYTEGATHAANEIAVQAGQVDLATDFDRNRNAMIESGRLKADSTQIYWTSAALPNDALALPKTASQEFAEQVRKTVTAISVADAKTLLPNHYTGFVSANHESYASIEKAGVAVGRIKKS